MKSAAEFKAWMEGFSESFKNGKPNKEQWERIQEELEGLYDKQLYYYPYSYPQITWQPQKNYTTITTNNTDDMLFVGEIFDA